MAVCKLVNLGFGCDASKKFEFEGYKFLLDESIPKNMLAQNRRYCQNGKVDFEGNQEDTIIFRSDNEIGVRGPMYNPQKKKLLDDLLIIGSLLTGTNWRRYADRECKNFPTYPTNSLDNIVNYENEIQDCFDIVMQTVRKPAWQKQFHNGFHLRMFLNRTNISNLETRFLGCIVIWEWLYPHLKKPNGATQKDEESRLNKIILFILENYWNSKIEKSKYKIIKVIRNQLTHSGKFPIDRGYAEEWMRQLMDDEIYRYMLYFEQLTQIVIFKTLGINCEYVLCNPDVFFESG